MHPIQFVDLGWWRVLEEAKPERLCLLATNYYRSTTIIPTIGLLESSPFWRRREQFVA